MEKIESGQYLVIADAGPIIHLHEISALEVLRDFNRVLITDKVWKEILKHCSPILEQLPIDIVPNPAPEKLVEGLAKTYWLQSGEKTALSLALQYQYAIFATDDMAARLAANQIGLRVHGTVGILLRSVRTGRFSQDTVRGFLQDIPRKSSLFIKKSLLDAAIDELKLNSDNN